MDWHGSILKCWVAAYIKETEIQFYFLNANEKTYFAHMHVYSL